MYKDPDKKKQYDRGRYSRMKNDSTFIARRQKWTDDNRAHINTVRKKWRRKHRNDENYKKHNCEYYKKYREKLRKKIMELIGFKCVICETEKSIEFHEIHGKKHPIGFVGLRYTLNHIKDFVPLCTKHHMAVHRSAEIFYDKTAQELVKTILEHDVS